MLTFLRQFCNDFESTSVLVDVLYEVRSPQAHTDVLAEELCLNISVFMFNSTSIAPTRSHESTDL